MTASNAKMVIFRISIFMFMLSFVDESEFEKKTKFKEVQNSQNCRFLKFSQL